MWENICRITEFPVQWHPRDETAPVSPGELQNATAQQPRILAVIRNFAVRA